MLDIFQKGKPQVDPFVKSCKGKNILISKVNPILTHAHYIPEIRSRKCDTQKRPRTHLYFIMTNSIFSKYWSLVLGFKLNQ